MCGSYEMNWEQKFNVKNGIRYLSQKPLVPA